MRNGQAGTDVRKYLWFLELEHRSRPRTGWRSKTRIRPLVVVALQTALFEFYPTPRTETVNTTDRIRRSVTLIS